MSPAPRGPMKTPKPSEGAKADFAGIVPDAPAITLKPMFGQVSAFVNGNMFCGLWGDELVVRLPEPDLAKVKAAGGRDFEPVAGHKMGGYVVVAGDWRKEAAPARTLVKRALEVARALPPKAPKAKPAAARKK